MRLVIVLAVLLSVVALIGCGGDTDTSGDAVTQDQSAAVVDQPSPTKQPASPTVASPTPPDQIVPAVVAETSTPTPMLVESPSPYPTQAPVVTNTHTPMPEPSVKPTPGLTRENPVPMGESLLTPSGIEITVLDSIAGERVWTMLGEAYANKYPEEGMEYALITVKVVNVNSETASQLISYRDFELVGSHGKVYHPYDNKATLLKDGPFGELRTELYHGGEETGVVDFYIPVDETEFVLIWDDYDDENKRFLAIDLDRRTPEILKQWSGRDDFRTEEFIISEIPWEIYWVNEHDDPDNKGIVTIKTYDATTGNYLGAAGGQEETWSLPTDITGTFYFEIESVATTWEVFVVGIE